jgi:peptidoglycan/xylan/chitin deacetylase (PgdA/CDA1 family)
MDPGNQSLFNLDRRGFLSIAALGAASIALATDSPPPAEAAGWPADCITTLPPSKTRRLAWTVDDGSSTSTLSSYLKLLERNDDLKMTMFVLSCSTAWKTHEKRIRELIRSGQIQMANHTRDHKNLNRCSNKEVAKQLIACDKFIKDTYEVDPAGYWRPPYGSLSKRVISIAADNGFDKPTLWDGSTGSSFTSKTESVWKNAQRYMTNGRIVVDHANGKATVNNFDRIMRMLKSRELATVTLNEAFEKKF